MNDEQIADIRARLESGATYPYEWTKRVTIKQMAEYLKAVHPELYVVLNDWSCRKDTKAGRQRIPGVREYKGYRLKVWRSKEDYLKSSRYANLIDHNTTETYRRNYEVAKKIIQYEREKKRPDECPECRELLEGNFDDTGLICPECSYEYKFKQEAK